MNWDGLDVCKRCGAIREYSDMRDGKCYPICRAKGATMKLIASTLLILAIATTCTANDYVYRNGYYYLGNQAYNRYSQQYYVQGPCYYSGSYYPQGYYYTAYTYTPYYPPVEAPKPAITPQTTNYIEALVRYAAERDKDDRDLRNFGAAVKILGLEGSPRVGYVGNAYGYGSGYSVQHLNYQKMGYQGLNAQADLFNSNDINVALQQAAAIVRAANDGGNKAVIDFNSTVSGMAQANAQARADFIRFQALIAIANPPSTTVQKTTVQQGSQLLPSPNPMATPSKDDEALNGQINEEAWRISAQADCAKCHGNEVKKGKFSVWEMSKLSAKELQDLADRLTSTDPARLMPRSDDTHPGEPLGKSKLRIWEWKLNALAKTAK